MYNLVLWHFPYILSPKVPYCFAFILFSLVLCFLSCIDTCQLLVTSVHTHLPSSFLLWLRTHLPSSLLLFSHKHLPSCLLLFSHAHLPSLLLPFSYCLAQFLARYLRTFSPISWLLFLHFCCLFPCFLSCILLPCYFLQICLRQDRFSAFVMFLSVCFKL